MIARRLAMIVLFAVAAPACAQQALPSWRDGDAKQAIIEFVERVTDESSADYVEPIDRIAVFDNDGTLWSEQPMYFQLAFMIDRVHALVPEHPEWSEEQPFKAILEEDWAALAAQGEHGLLELAKATHGGMTSDEFAAIVSQWIATARHPRFDRPYNELVFQPMLEVLDYLRANGFTTFIVSGGGIAFMRPWVYETYGIPPHQVVGSGFDLKFELREGLPVIVRQGALDFYNDKAAKPVGIQRHIGQRPIAAFGNSDGDLQMLQWTDAGPGLSLQLIVHHTDAEREWAYDRDSKIGRLDKALDEANSKGWVVVDMKRDWAGVYPPAR